MDGLTPKQEAFCMAYAGECKGNATEAYKKAGYNVKNDKTAGVNATRLLGNARVQARLAEIDKKIESNKIMDVSEMQERLTAIARQEATETDYTIDGKEFQRRAGFRESLKAIELLGKMKGAFYTRQEIDVRGAVPVVLADNVHD